MLNRDDLYRISLDELRDEYEKLTSELEFEQETNKEITEDYSDLQDLLIQRDNEINALKHMLDRKEEEK